MIFALLLISLLTNSLNSMEALLNSKIPNPAVEMTWLNQQPQNKQEQSTNKSDLAENGTEKPETIPADYQIDWLDQSKSQTKFQKQQLVTYPPIQPTNKFDLEEICMDLMLLNILEKYRPEYKFMLKISSHLKLTKLKNLESERDARIIIQKAKGQNVDKFLNDRAVRSLVSLKQLILKDHDIHQLDPEISQLTSLEHLDLENNRLWTLPSSIRSLTKLRSLKVKKNPLQYLPNCLCLINVSISSDQTPYELLHKEQSKF